MASEIQIDDIGLIGWYDKQQFPQFNPQDVANWYLTDSENGTRKTVMYPCAGRRHIEFLDQVKLQFPIEPRGMFVGSEYAYIVVSDVIYRVDENYNTIDISQGDVVTFSGNVYFSRLVTGLVSFACFCDGRNIYIYREDTKEFSVVTSAGIPPTGPVFMVTFGERLMVGDVDSSFIYYSRVNLDGGAFDPTTCFAPLPGNVGGGFISVRDIVRQLGVLHNTLYIFMDYTTAVWSNIPTRLPNGSLAPFKQSTAVEWDYGISDPQTLDIDFGMMTFLAKNRNGAIQVMTSNGGTPKDLNTKAIDLLFKRDALNDNQSPFFSMESNGFLYQEDDTIFYRISTSNFEDFQDNDIDTSASALEFNYNTGKWHRVIEYNGQRNRINKHIFFPDRHLVTLLGEGTVYEMSTQFYTNEQLIGDEYVAYPMRYESISPVLSSPEFAEFKTEYVQIDMVFGDGFPHLENPFANTQFIIAEGNQQFLITEDSDPDNPTYIIDEEATVDGDPVFIVAEDLIFDPENPTYIEAEDSDPDNPTLLVTEGSDTPQLNETFYRNLYKPHVELHYSDDGGISYQPADIREFSPLGHYQWRMRWYQLGNWRMRNYKLIFVGPNPAVVISAFHAYKRISSGAN